MATRCGHGAEVARVEVLYSHCAGDHAHSTIVEGGISPEYSETVTCTHVLYGSSWVPEVHEWEVLELGERTL